jgi:hypothetical protein
MAVILHGLLAQAYPLDDVVHRQALGHGVQRLAVFDQADHAVGRGLVETMIKLVTEARRET